MIHIGTSGWHYDHWQGPFYPDGLRKKDLLGYYANFLQTVEINNTFYQLPERETLAKWRDDVPAGFLFAVKASRYITHMKKLKDPQKPVAAFLKRVEVLGNKLGPILFQLPPRWHFNPERLDAFLQTLPQQNRYAFEFRDASWFTKEALQMLQDRNAAFCIYEFADFASPRYVTADFVYLRFHGPEGTYRGQYATGALADWAAAIGAWTRQKKDIFCYFNNDEAGYAVQDALRLKAMLPKN